MSALTFLDEINDQNSEYSKEGQAILTQVLKEGQAILARINKEPMKIYLACRPCHDTYWDDYTVVAVFTTNEKAEAYCASKNGPDSLELDLFVTEIEVTE